MKQVTTQVTPTVRDTHGPQRLPLPREEPPGMPSPSPGPGEPQTEGPSCLVGGKVPPISPEGQAVSLSQVLGTESSPTSFLHCLHWLTPQRPPAPYTEMFFGQNKPWVTSEHLDMGQRGEGRSGFAPQASVSSRAAPNQGGVIGIAVPTQISS